MKTFVGKSMTRKKKQEIDNAPSMFSEKEKSRKNYVLYDPIIVYNAGDWTIRTTWAAWVEAEWWMKHRRFIKLN